MFTVIVLNCLKNVFTIALKPAQDEMADLMSLKGFLKIE